MKVKILDYCAYSAYDSGAHGHPQELMKELGITYQHATPQSMYDSWWFWNCENLPKDLPPYLEVRELDPFEAIGHGLNKEMATKISNYIK